jgi:TRAP-type C4-dicarboxylate transport system substrate-binding protein
MTQIKAVAAFAGISAAAMIVSAAQAATLNATSGLVKTDKQTLTFLELFHKPVNKADNGITINYKGGPEVIPNRKQGAALKRGAIDMVFAPAGYYSGLVPCARVVALSTTPQKTIRTNGGWEVLQSCWKKYLNARILSHPFENATKFHMYLMDKPKLSDTTGLDLKGVTLRASALYVPFMKKMGARPTNISPGDVYTSLQRGLVRGLAWPMGNIYRYGWTEYIKYRVGPGFWRSSSMLIINLNAYNKLTKKERAAIDAAGLKMEIESTKFYGDIGKIDTAKVKKSGVKFVTLSGKAGAAFTKTVYGATWDAAEKKIPADMFKQLRKYLLQ